MPEPIEMLQEVAHALGPLLEEVVFVGGTIPALLITDPAAPPIRPTNDVDLVVDSHSLQEHARFEERLRKRGFQVAGPPICRYCIGNVLVDVMTTTTKATGFSDRWYGEAFSTAEPARLPNGSIIRVIRPPLFLATKLSAWHDRSHGDHYTEDMEDIIAVIDGRSTLLDEIIQSSCDVRRFLAQEFRQLLAAPGFIDAVPGHLGGGPIAHERAEIVLDVFRRIVEIDQG